MKKLTTVLIAAGLIASASACSAQQQLTTAETCDRINVVVPSFPQGPGQTAANRAANAVRPIVNVASADMKPVVTSILAYLDELAKDEPQDAAEKEAHQAKLEEATAGFQEAGTKYGELCRG
ncbi:hypothetical protein SAMN04487917_105230 [Arthrobacter sp. yr096]|uniref:hypothetical protein n=1 Tax=unclassified Arthrobacter TaxID=235627 RepID=UPI000894F4A9|nr:MULTISPECIES: hypothetical protein [unclassified Arthrobacter]SDW72003.1 hypothetical protein SAMN04487912_104204 [Arthrobacter sp. cf158]SEJ37580.1 hypothetical protein SAMN04487917_105230 [Arthrobacter sp. yr096]